MSNRYGTTHEKQEKLTPKKRPRKTNGEHSCNTVYLVRHERAAAPPPLPPCLLRPSVPSRNFRQITDQKMGSFVRGVAQRYRPHNPYHNLVHAVSVTHVSFAIVKTTKVDSLLRPLDKLALLVAAFCHDIDHPG